MRRRQTGLRSKQHSVYLTPHKQLRKTGLWVLNRGKRLYLGSSWEARVCLLLAWAACNEASVFLWSAGPSTLLFLASIKWAFTDDRGLPGKPARLKQTLKGQRRKKAITLSPAHSIWLRAQGIVGSYTEKNAFQLNKDCLSITGKISMNIQYFYIKLLHYF